jgi:hypothetical protein
VLLGMPHLGMLLQQTTAVAAAPACCNSRCCQIGTSEQLR